METDHGDMILHTNKATRFWDDATMDFSVKKQFLWASLDTRSKLETPHDRMQPAFFSTYKTVNVLFRCQVIAQLFCEYCLVKNGSFGDCSLKVHTSTLTQPHLATGSSASPSNARSNCNISSHILFESRVFIEI